MDKYWQPTIWFVKFSIDHTSSVDNKPCEHLKENVTDEMKIITITLDNYKLRLFEVFDALRNLLDKSGHLGISSLSNQF